MFPMIRLRATKFSSMEIVIVRFNLLIFVTIVGVAHQVDCDVMNDLTFEQQTLPRVNLLSLEGTRTRRVLNFPSAEERQKLCLYAQMEAKLPYLDHNEVSHWYEIGHDPDILIDDRYRYGTSCATLPTIYVLQKPFGPDLLIASVHSPVSSEFLFNASAVTAESVSFSEELEKGQPFSKLELEDYRNLCNMAREHVEVRFLDRNVKAAGRYEFTWNDGRQEIDVAVPCPTVPRLYLRLRKSNVINEVHMMVLHRSPIDEYEFEVNEEYAISISQEEGMSLESPLSTLSPEERLRLCAVARRYHYSAFPILFVDDETVTEAETYQFRYSEEAAEYDVAILCPALPNIYLRVENSSGKSKITLNFFKTSVDEYTYSTEVIEYVYLLSPVGGRKRFWEESRIKEHLFSALTKEEQWRLCIGAQKYVLSNPQIKFTFASQGHVFSERQLIISPKYVTGPQLENFSLANSTLEADVLIQCSEWPVVYLRQQPNDGEFNQNVNVVFLKYQLSVDMSFVEMIGDDE